MALEREVAARAIRQAIRRPETLEFFFDSLQSPEWIEPLIGEGLLSSPPEQFVEDGLVHAPPWPASRYLARVAAAAPEAVLHVASQIKTNNERVAEDFADAAMAMPLRDAEAMAELLLTFMEKRGHLYYLLPRKLVNLGVRFAKEGAPDLAARLMLALFAPEPTSDDGTYWRARTKPRFTHWEYDMHLRKLVEQAIPAAPHLFLHVFVDLLEQALKVLRTDSEEPDSDGSRAWRVRVSDDRDRTDDPEEALTSAIRDAARVIREQSLMTDDELVTNLTQYPGELYRRLAMHALAVGPEPDLPVARRFALDHDAITHYEPSPEFRELVRRLAESLSTEDIEDLVGVIRAGPDVADYRALKERVRGAMPTEGDVERYVAQWQIGRFALLEQVLPQDARTLYDTLVQRFGQTELPLSWEVTTAVGYKSPAAADELLGLTDDELVAYLERWEPSPGDEFAGPSTEGLARTVSAMAESQPERMSSLAPRLRGVRPAYIQWMMNGLERAIETKPVLDWDALIELMLWIVDQPREIEGGRRDTYADLDPGWVWTRGAMLGLVERALRAAPPTRLPRARRHDAWRLIEALVLDPEPTSEYEERYGQDNMDPVTLSLNTTRPRAVRAAIAYAIWVYQDTFGTDAPGAGGFFSNEAPEVAALIHQRLNPDIERSPAVRAVIGEFYANLYALDPVWARAVIKNVFPPNDSPLRAAAWGAYIIYTRPYDNMFGALRDVYQRSAQLSDGSDHGFRWMNSTPVESLGIHVAAFVWRGVLPVDDELVSTYWSQAPSEARAHMLETLGRWSRETVLSIEVVGRLQEMWSWAKERAASEAVLDELAGFSWWFAADELPVDWRLSELRALLERGVKPQAPWLITETLPRIAAERSREAVELIRPLIDVEDHWLVGPAEDEIERVLQIAFASDDATARSSAYETVNRLLARGYRRFAAVVDGHAP